MMAKDNEKSSNSGADPRAFPGRLRVDQIIQALPKDLVPQVTLELLSCVDSTSDELVRRARAGDVSGQVLMAEQQTAGRGRRGRPWISPPGKNVYLSLAWDVLCGVEALAGLSLAVGCSIAESLDDCVQGVLMAGGQGSRQRPDDGRSSVNLQLKWPNDIYGDGQKLGGVIVDIARTGEGRTLVVVGIGINVAAQPTEEQPIDEQPLGQPVTSLIRLINDLGPSVDSVDLSEQGHAYRWADADSLSLLRADVVARVLTGLIPLLATWHQVGFGFWRSRWQGRDVMRDRRVSLSGSESLVGVARGVDEQGALLVETEDGVRTIFGGDVSLRPYGKVT